MVWLRIVEKLPLRGMLRGNVRAAPFAMVVMKEDALGIGSMASLDILTLIPMPVADEAVSP